MNKNSDKQYYEYRLVKSWRDGVKVRQTIILTMPDIRLPQSQWKQLADSIEALMTGQNVLFPDPAVEAEAERWFNHIKTKQAKASPIVISKPKTESDYVTISLSSVTIHHPQTIGAEHIALSMYKELGIDQIFGKLGFSRKQMNEAALSIIGRMLEPGSEYATATWARTHTGLGELLGMDLSKLSHNALYRITDQIYQHKEHLESTLRETERTIFNLTENIFLYDLTNTYLEGTGKKIPKAKFGRSKEKRTDCRLLTLGLVLDDMGFPKRSKVMSGSVGEPGTLQQMIAGLADTGEGKAPIVVMDAGISSEANLAYLRTMGYDYICVARNQPIPPELIDAGQFIDIESKGDNTIKAQVFPCERETVLYCYSEKKELKERAMQDKFCSRLEEQIDLINTSLQSKHGKKKFDYILERVSKLKEKHKSVSRFYTIEIEQENGIATIIKYHCSSPDALDYRYNGSYFLRTSIMDMDAQKLWSVYMMLNTVESAFRTLKSELSFRPVYHQIETRAEAHLFIAVLAYHIVNAIQHRLKNKDIKLSWDTIRKMMCNHQVTLTTMKTKNGWQLSILDTTAAEDNHLNIYQALGISSHPIKRKTTKTKVL